MIGSAFLLPLLAAAATATAQEMPSPALVAEAGAEHPDHKVKCRKIKVTGSLVRTEKICKTVLEWRRLRESGNSAARDITDYSRSRPGGQ